MKKSRQKQTANNNAFGTIRALGDTHEFAQPNQNSQDSLHTQI
jgi:hypothetical protein